MFKNKVEPVESTAAANPDKNKSEEDDEKKKKEEDIPMVGPIEVVSHVVYTLSCRETLAGLICL